MGAPPRRLALLLLAGALLLSVAAALSTSAGTGHAARSLLRVWARTSALSDTELRGLKPGQVGRAQGLACVRQREMCSLRSSRK